MVCYPNKREVERRKRRGTAPWTAIPISSDESSEETDRKKAKKHVTQVVSTSQSATTASIPVKAEAEHTPTASNSVSHADAETPIPMTAILPRQPVQLRQTIDVHHVPIASGSLSHLQPRRPGFQEPPDDADTHPPMVMDNPPPQAVRVDWRQAFEQSRKSHSVAISYRNRLGAESPSYSQNGDDDVNTARAWPNIPIRGTGLGSGIMSIRTTGLSKPDAANMSNRPAYFYSLDLQSARKSFSLFFGTVKARSSWAHGWPSETAVIDMAVLQCPVPRYVLDLYNLEGSLMAHESLSFEMVAAGIRQQLQDLDKLVWVPSTMGWNLQLDVKGFTQSAEEREIIRNRRYLVFPLHEDMHWCLGIYDQAYHAAYFFDSSTCDGARRRGRRFLDQSLEPWLAAQGLKTPTREPLTRQHVQTTSQRASWESGLFVMENVRVFFREQHLHPNTPAVDWTISHNYDQEPRQFQSRNDPRDTMWKFWMMTIRLEIGDGTPLREPERPTIALTQGAWISNLPNSFAQEHVIPTAGLTRSNQAGLDELPSSRPRWGRSGTTRAESCSRPSSPEHDVAQHRSQREHDNDSGRNKPENPATAPPPSPQQRGSQPLDLDHRRAPLIDSPTEKTELRPTAQKRSTYDHRTESTRHVSPSHQEGWPGWTNWIIEKEEEDELAQYREQMEGRSLRAAKRRRSVD